MAATDLRAASADALRPPAAPARALLGGLVLAACALPGVMPQSAQAEEAPEQAVVSFKLSGYDEWQPTVDGASSEEARAARNGRSARTRALATTSGASGGGGLGLGSGDTRMSIVSPSVHALLPLGRHWAAEGSLTVDEVSGASPKYYADMSGASHMEDRRTAGDLKLTRYFERQSLSLGLARSREADYLSQALSLEGRLASEDQNTTLNLGLGLTHDDIAPRNGKVAPTTKRTREFQIGVTQALNPRDIVQASLTLSRAKGYLNDPYKLYDERPDHRNATIVQLRWNHWLGQSTLKLGYRLYRDSYDLRAHTWEAAWVLPLGERWTLTPDLRYYTQNAARFYYDANPDSALYPAPAAGATVYSSDQRLAAWGALTVGTKLSWQFAKDWTADAKASLYEQRAAWRLGGEGSPGLQPLTALFWQFGLSHAF
ncbi:DUF3570 domain-containing protein [Ideonella livida]|uniref:DUF3570 domain-containing protein n=1 Tax=Ideonella livida TaxID=2707176 RepID=A0A7C9PJE7_9BURK|nr:DUF3570 domain-containing protein [Ideonella livida]NDY93497.1 DUF3570 domain-containing protein [Ideonella livida]